LETSREEILQEKLDQAELALERSERLVIANQHAGAIMHEVNNPLEAITNLVYITKHQPDDPKQVFDNMCLIEQQLEALSQVTHQSLTFHREQGNAKEFDLADIAESALNIYAEKIVRHGVIVTRQFSRPAPIHVFGSEILQVVSNLILNALDALPLLGGYLTVRVKPNRRFTNLMVSDNGQGIPDELARKLFQPYVTGKSTGTGLGLWLSKRIIARHQGTLTFRSSQKGRRPGTSFRISLPTPVA